MLLRVLIAVLAVTLLVLLALLLPLLRDPQAARRRVEGLFRRPEKPGPLPSDHYYRPYWS